MSLLYKEVDFKAPGFDPNSAMCTVAQLKSILGLYGVPMDGKAKKKVTRTELLERGEEEQKEEKEEGLERGEKGKEEAEENKGLRMRRGRRRRTRGLSAWEGVCTRRTADLSA